MSLDGSRGDLIEAWAQHNLPPRKRRDGSISVEVERECSTIYSYAVPIASIFLLPGMPTTLSVNLGPKAPQFAVLGSSGSLERTSMTTNRHLREVDRALGSSQVRHIALLIQGTVPSSMYEWVPFVKFFEVVHAPNLSPQAKALWDAFEETPYDEQVWRVLADLYFEHGFSEGVPGWDPQTTRIRIEPDGFHLTSSHSPDIVLR